MTTITEAEILSRQSYSGDEAPPETVEAMAFDLVNQLMHQLRGEYDLQAPIDRLTDQQKMALHGRLWQIAVAALKREPLKAIAPAPADPVPVPSSSGLPLEPESDGAVFTVQVGGALEPERKPDQCSHDWCDWQAWGNDGQYRRQCHKCMEVETCYPATMDAAVVEEKPIDMSIFNIPVGP